MKKMSVNFEMCLGDKIILTITTYSEKKVQKGKYSHSLPLFPFQRLTGKVFLLKDIRIHTFLFYNFGSNLSHFLQNKLGFNGFFKAILYSIFLVFL